MVKFLINRWFLVSLTGLIALGLALGINWAGPVKPLADAMNPLLMTASILFLMSFSLETRQLQAALKTPVPVLLGAALNMGLAPLLGAALMAPQGLADFRYGLLVASCVPCTMAAASVWTRKAHGNDAISLLVTLVTNSVSIITIPVWLMLATTWFPLDSTGTSITAVADAASVGADAGSIRHVPSVTDVPAINTADSSSLTGNGPLLDLRQTVFELVIGVLLPIILGQFLRQPARLSAWATRHKVGINATAQILILVMVWTAAVKGGVRISQTKLIVSLSSILLVWGSVIVVHLVTLYAGLFLSRTLRVARADQIAVAFAGSQKTLPVGLLLSETLSHQAGLSFAVFPMLMYHASQLFLDTIIAERFVAEETAGVNAD